MLVTTRAKQSTKPGCHSSGLSYVLAHTNFREDSLLLRGWVNRASTPSTAGGRPTRATTTARVSSSVPSTAGKGRLSARGRTEAGGCGWEPTPWTPGTAGTCGSPTAARGKATSSPMRSGSSRSNPQEDVVGVASNRLTRWCTPERDERPMRSWAAEPSYANFGEWPF